MESEFIPEEKTKPSMKFFLGGFMIVMAVVYLIYSATRSSSQYFLTVDEVIQKGDEVMGRELRISGAVIGDTIAYDSENLVLTFTIANIPGDNKEIEEKGGLAKVLHDAVVDQNNHRLNVVYTEGPKPDLLRHEAQAIMTGRMGEDGVFLAEELLLKCPTKYEDAVPDQVNN